MMFESDSQRRGFAFRLALFYGAVFVIYGTQLPYLSVWLQYRGLDAQQIGLVTSLPLFARLLFTPGVALVADRLDRHRQIVILLSWTALAAVIAMPYAKGLWPILLIVLIFLLATQSTMPLVETVAMRGVHRGGLDYGRMRLWGSLTFIVANIAGGWMLAAQGAGSIALLLIIGAAMSVVAAHLLPQPPPVADDGDRSRRLGLREVAHLLVDTRFVLLIIATGSIQASHAVYYGFGTLHWQTQGISPGWFGLLWAIGVIVEVALFAVSGRAVALAGAGGLLLIGGIAAVARWSAMALDPPLVLLIGLQILHGLTFGATHLAAMHLIGQLVPERQAGTAQALHATVTAGIAMGGAMLIAGAIYSDWQGTSYLAMAALAAVGLASATMLWLRSASPT